jgi:hypothetical protein
VTPPPDQATGPAGDHGDTRMTATYIRVMVVEVLVLAALFAFQQYFSR